MFMLIYRYPGGYWNEFGKFRERLDAEKVKADGEVGYPDREWSIVNVADYQ